MAGDSPSPSTSWVTWAVATPTISLVWALSIDMPRSERMSGQYDEAPSVGPNLPADPKISLLKRHRARPPMRQTLVEKFSRLAQHTRTASGRDAFAATRPAFASPQVT